MMNLYIIEFLDLSKNFKEPDLRNGLIQNMKDFILEVGKEFTFVDEEYLVQVTVKISESIYYFSIEVCSAWFHLSEE
ncbi:MAG: PDDEXK nuclease domain-containing protein [Lachnospiraceae bacterium]